MTEHAAAGATAPAIELEGLGKIFGPAPRQHLQALRSGLDKVELQRRSGQVLALRDISLKLSGGAITVLMGLSGSGKSTLLRHINRLVEPTAGRVRCAGIDVTALGAAALQDFRRRHIAMVFQHFALFPHRNVLRNVGYALEIRGVESTERDAVARRWIERVGLRGHEHSWPAQLSGGMRQRVGLARALAGDVPVLLMDEPFSALDPLIRSEMQDLLLALQHELRKTVVFVSHDLDEALRLGQQIVILREGMVVQQGNAADIVLRPADDHVRRFAAGVNRGRALRCAMLAVPAPAVAGPTLAGHATLAEAARILQAQGASQANVCDASGQALGTITLQALIEQITA